MSEYTDTPGEIIWGLLVCLALALFVVFMIAGITLGIADLVKWLS